jgi:hypothetical protein
MKMEIRIIVDKIISSCDLPINEAISLDDYRAEYLDQLITGDCRNLYRYLKSVNNPLALEVFPLIRRKVK